MYLEEKKKTKKEMHVIIDNLGLGNLGFEAIYDIGSTSIFFKRKIKDKEEWLMLILNKNKYGFKISIEHTSWVTFPLVNSILRKAKIDTVNNWWKEEGHYRLFATCLPITSKTLQNKNNLSLDFYFKIKQGQIETETSRTHLNEIISYILNNTLPKLKAIDTLGVINQQVIAKNKAADLIPGEFGYKQMVIMKLCNNPDYDSYTTDYETNLKKGIELNYEKYQPYLEFFFRLKEVLQNYPIKYI